MKTFLPGALLSLAIAATGTPTAVIAQDLTGTSRKQLSQHDLSIPGWEEYQVRVDFQPGKTAPNHRHPGEEIIYVIEGTIEYRVEGRPPATLKAGDVLFVPAGAVHSAKNVGTDNAAELGTYVVQKGKPLTEWVK
ncbi:MAG: cupin domain-containing protein [Luteibacter sp.]